MILLNNAHCPYILYRLYISANCITCRPSRESGPFCAESQAELLSSISAGAPRIQVPSRTSAKRFTRIPHHARSLSAIILLQSNKNNTSQKIKILKVLTKCFHVYRKQWMVHLEVLSAKQILHLNNIQYCIVSAN